MRRDEACKPSTFTPFEFARPLTDYCDEKGEPLPGNEWGTERALPWCAIDDLHRARAKHMPTEFLVGGEWRTDDGKTYVQLVVNPRFVEWTTNWRHLEGRFRWVCPECGLTNDAHTRACSRRVGARR